MGDYSFDFSGVTGSGFNTFTTANMTGDLFSGFGSNANFGSGINTSAYQFTDAKRPKKSACSRPRNAMN